jgi:hypothetical protein
MEPETTVARPDDGIEGHVPGESHEDDGEEDGASDDEVAGALGRVKALENRPNLQADEDKREDVQREDDRLPHGICRDADPCGNARGRGLRHRDRVAHHRQHRRKPKMLCEQPHAERRDELKNDGGRDVLHTIEQPQGDPSERRTHDHAAGDCEEKRRGHGANGEAVRGDGAYGEAVDEERARVIQQAFALEDCEEAMGRSQRAEHSSCGDGIRWGDHSAQRNRRGPRHRRDDRAGDDGDGNCCESDREYHESRDRRPIVLEVSQRRVVCRVEQYGRDEQRQRKLGRESEGGRDRKKGEQCPAERQEHRIRCANAARRGRENDGCNKQREKLFELPHLTDTLALWRVHPILQSTDQIVTRLYMEPKV